MSSLIGVAISTSILPPIANSGMYFARGLFQLGAIDGSWQGSWEVGGYSLALFVVNVICIILSAGFIFWLKGVRPLKRVKPAPVDRLEQRLAAEEFELDEATEPDSDVERYEPRMPPDEWMEHKSQVPMHLDWLWHRSHQHHDHYTDAALEARELRRTQSAHDIRIPPAEPLTKNPSSHIRTFSHS